MDFKDSLKYRREREGYTQAILADKVGISQQVLAGFERGTRLANHVIVIGLAKALECSTDELLGLSET